MADFTFLKGEQIWDKKALPMFEEIGTATKQTDLSAILGGIMYGNGNCAWWSASPYDDNYVRCVDFDGDLVWNSPYKRHVAARPASTFSKIKKISPNGVRGKEYNKYFEYYAGEYPQTAVDENLSERLDNMQRAGLLKHSGKSYTFDSLTDEEKDKEFKPRVCPEYIYNGEKYICLNAIAYDGDSCLLTGEKVENGKKYWVKVEPIKWLVDKKTEVAISDKPLFAGVQFDKGFDYDGNFDRTNMAKYLNDYFSKEIVPDLNFVKDREASNKNSKTSRRKGYGITIDDVPMPVKDQIDFYIQNGMSFMLHGPSGIGKTGRVEAIDPDLTAVPLWNGVLPEDIVGKVRYPNGEIGLPEDFVSEMLKYAKENGGAEEIKGMLSAYKQQSGGIWEAPDWYNELCKKCEKEPNKKHVLFIDEVTNARETTQSLIFHVVLKHSISPSKGKLPDNAVVVAAGNSKEESGAAYNMPAPLFRRMAGHIYLKPNVADWLEWGSEPNREHPERFNIHPLISSFVATYGEQLFYSNYDEDEPPTWAIDPRGWEQISDIIYNNKGVIRRELLENKCGKEIASSLIAFAQNPPLSLEEVLDGEYSRRDIPEVQDAKLALTLSLRIADEKQVSKVRRFINEHLGRENLAIFDSVWVGSDAERALLIAGDSSKTGGFEL